MRAAALSRTGNGARANAANKMGIVKGIMTPQPWASRGVTCRIPVVGPSVASVGTKRQNTNAAIAKKNENFTSTSAGIETASILDLRVYEPQDRELLRISELFRPLRQSP